MVKPLGTYALERIRAIEKERLEKIAAQAARPDTEPRTVGYDDALDEEPSDFFAYIWPDLE
ncbi:MAG: hypothetical protein EOR11_19880 [Mesorhizobium sp.]|uniref:hypothetical protein n=1 Tax=Mesorhizobium sp. TaxID=1871066 RepID=UPI000FE65200|nr:hypothetical protein [Mesorhizobium sp.]RWP84722.1 MAG: hypothetical protein EOR11_19880 [Mesorhizobium sp.]